MLGVGRKGPRGSASFLCESVRASAALEKNGAKKGEGPISNR